MLLPPKQIRHEVTPHWSHDDKARQSFQRTMRERMLKLSAGTRAIYENRVKPHFEKANGRSFSDRRELREYMQKEPFYQMYVASQRVAQELMWASITYAVDRQLDDLIDRATPNGPTKGSLTIDPEFVPPRYVSAVDIHCMPGGYCETLKDRDVAAGAIYEKGSYIYGSGRGGRLGEGLGRVVIGYIKREHPKLEPLRILDMGCAIGNCTLPYCDAYPDAEIQAIDAGPALLRYGHARAESLGKTVHFSLQNAEHTNFEDESFDLVVSHIMFHEMSRKALPNSLKESYRLLKHGGLMIHADAGQYAGMDLYRQLIFDNEVYNNNEPFWSTMRELDLEALAIEVGFDRNKVHLHMEPMGPPPPARQNNKPPERSTVVLGFHLLVGQK